MCEKDTDKLKDFRVDAAAHNIDVRPVHINKSGENFRISDGKIYFGFSNIKHIGIEVAAEIVAGQPYNSFADFLNRFGTNAATIKALVSLGVFDEIEPTHDHLTLYKFYEYYKDVIDKRKARAKRYQQSLIKYEIAVKDLLLTEIKEDHPDFISMCKFDEEAINLWRMFVDVKREINYIHKGVEKIKEVSLEKQLHDIADKRQSSVKNFAQKEIDSDEEVITLNNFSSSKIKLDKELEEMLVNFATHKSHRYYPIAESAYYGFQWSSNVERSPLYKGYTIDVFLQKTEIEGELFSSIEVEIASCTKRSSKKGVEFYTVGVEDANGKNMMVNVWLDDYLRFKEELKKGTLVRMECKPPTGGFRTLTFNAPQKRFRSKLPNKEDDMRLMVLPQANEDPCVDLTGLVMNDN
jgi:DNA polymerase III alpha subunit